jgi:hypothetical protein
LLPIEAIMELSPPFFGLREAAGNGMGELCRSEEEGVTGMKIGASKHVVPMLSIHKSG